jgi:hypothetical protein
MKDDDTGNRERTGRIATLLGLTLALEDEGSCYRMYHKDGGSLTLCFSPYGHRGRITVQAFWPVPPSEIGATCDDITLSEKKGDEEAARDIKRRLLESYLGLYPSSLARSEQLKAEEKARVGKVLASKRCIAEAWGGELGRDDRSEDPRLHLPMLASGVYQRGLAVSGDGERVDVGLHSVPIELFVEIALLLRKGK